MNFRIANDWPQTKTVAPVRDFLVNHSLIVGQSRSGKTTVARRIVEEIVLQTRARVVIIDPNADFVTIDKPAASGKDPDFSRRWRARRRQFQVLSRRRGRPPGLLWQQLSTDEKQALLGLSPKDDFTEYQEFHRQLKYEQIHKLKSATFSDFQNSQYFEFANGETAERYRLWLKAVTPPELWAQGPKGNVDDALEDGRCRLVVLDLSTESQQVKYMLAARALEVLWRSAEAQRDEFVRTGGGRKRWPGTVVLIDEAHLFAPTVASDPKQGLIAERIERLADQGKKLNLFGILVTQQPGKLNPRVLSEFSNRIILRMNERVSLRALEEIYGGGRGRYDGTLTFPPGQGWGLIEGAMLSDANPPDAMPRMVRFLQGRTAEGGGAPPSDWI